MRRWLAILLLVILPLQFSWAAVADPCGHAHGSERGASAGHVGHGAHATHAADAAQAAQADDPGHPAGAEGDNDSAGTGQDCGHGPCHGHCFGLFGLPRAFEAIAPGGMLPDLCDTARIEPLLAEPERPQWAPLA